MYQHFPLPPSVHLRRGASVPVAAAHSARPSDAEVVIPTAATSAHQPLAVSLTIVIINIVLLLGTDGSLLLLDVKGGEAGSGVPGPLGLGLELPATRLTRVLVQVDVVNSPLVLHKIVLA